MGGTFAAVTFYLHHSDFTFYFHVSRSDLSHARFAPNQGRCDLFFFSYRGNKTHCVLVFDVDCAVDMSRNAHYLLIFDDDF